MRITEASRRLGISARMLRYRETLGLLPVVRDRSAARRASRGSADRSVASGGSTDRSVASGGVSAAGPIAAHRQFGPADLDAVALGLAIERRYDISPAALAFGLRVLADPAARAQVAELGRRIGRIRPLPAMAMDFEKERALRFLGDAAGPRAGQRDRARSADPALRDARR
ncbi:MAG TPA: MerR family DNA-binding transcriptional regulator [Streptosporangiaceae bacterium]|nr:MerR family DNA-binding transcriptional regulator [Streptosporangiaceae bacterium]